MQEQKSFQNSQTLTHCERSRQFVGFLCVKALKREVEPNRQLPFNVMTTALIPRLLVTKEGVKNIVENYYSSEILEQFVM